MDRNLTRAIRTRSSSPLETVTPTTRAMKKREIEKKKDTEGDDMPKQYDKSNETR